MASGEWEVVGSSKKPKPSKQPAAAADKKNNAKGDKHSEKSVPNVKDATYSLQKFKLKREQKKEEPKDDFQDEAAPIATKTQKTAKKTAPAKPKTLKDAITKLNLSELQTLCKGLRTQFSDSPLIWLKDLASFLNVRISPAIPVDSAYRQEGSPGVPLDYVSKPIKEFLVRMVQNSGPNVLSQFHRHCFASMLQEAMRGLPVHGFAIFIQIVGIVNREACSTFAKDYISFREMYDNHPRPGLTYVWLMGQTITAATCAKHYTSAVNMWIEGLLPLVGSKHYSALSVQCGKEMVSRMEGLYHQSTTNFAATAASENNNNNNNKKGKSHGDNQATSNGTKPAARIPAVVTCDQLERLLDITFAPATQIPRPINKQLSDIFTKLKVVCGASSEGSAVFMRFFPRLLPSCSPAMAKEIGSTCGYCLLGNEAKCWNLWQNSLNAHMAPSAKLLKLLSSDEASAKALETPTAQKAIQTFDQLTEKKLQDNPVAKELHRELQRVKTTVATSLQNKKKSEDRSGSRGGSSSSFLSKLLSFFFWTLVILSTFGYACVLLHNNWNKFETSVLGELTEKAGVTEQVRSTVANIAMFTKTTASTTVSEWQHVLRVVQPYITVLQSRATDAANWISSSYPGAASVVSDASEKVAAAAAAGWMAVRPHIMMALEKINEFLPVTAGNKATR